MGSSSSDHKAAKRPRASKPAYERMLGRWEVDAETGCHNWSGAITTGGYGVIRDGGRSGRDLRTHLVRYVAERGAVPVGLVLDHLCRNRRCCNPDHLEPVTRKENTLRGVSPPAMQARQTHCKNGHEFDDDNTFVDYQGKRRCWTCWRAYHKAYKARAKALLASQANCSTTPRVAGKAV